MQYPPVKEMALEYGIQYSAEKDPCAECVEELQNM